MTRVLLLGATGYIGGEVLHQLSKQVESNIQLTCLVRDERKIPAVKAVYPEARIVVGGLDDIRTLKREVFNADIVLNLAATVHAVGVLAIAEAFELRRKGSKKPAYWVQMSGGSVFIAEEVRQKRFGYANEVVHDDLADRDRTISIINQNPDRISEHIVLRQPPDVIKTALLMGPHVYGRGRGPWNQRTVQCTEIARATLKLGYGFQLNDGANVWSTVHVADFANLVCLLVQAAIEGKDNGLWNQDGIYHPENGKMAFGELCSLIAREAQAQNLIRPSSEGLRSIAPDEANALSGHADILWGTNSVMTSTRAREKLGWVPQEHSLIDEIPMMVRQEARFLGLLTPNVRVD